MVIKLIAHNSHDYQKMIDLRMEVLLKPIGIPESYINKEKEIQDLLIGAFDNGELVGCCVLTSISENTIQLRQMAVKSYLQGKKIGALLVQFAEDLARENGYSKLMLHARNPVTGFYSKCGYTITGQEFYEVGIGHFRMEKDLNEKNKV